MSCSVIGLAMRPTGFAGFPTRMSCEETGDRCDDVADCLGKRCLPKPIEAGKCFLARHYPGGACVDARICPSKTSCETPDVAGTRPITAKPCFADAQCRSGELCVREGGCAQADQSGVCKARPATCEGKAPSPVCGCDLLGCPSECAAQQAGIDAAATGNCAPCLGRSDGSCCTTTLGYPAARLVVVCSESSVVSTEACAGSCETLGTGKAACN